MTAATDYPPVFSYVPAPSENPAGTDNGGISAVHHVGLPVHQQHQVARSQQQQHGVLPGHSVGLSGAITGAQQVLSRPSKWVSLCLFACNTQSGAEKIVWLASYS